MILIDYSQICHSVFYAQVNHLRSDELNEDFLRHMILNSIRSIKVKFKSYGDVVIATEGRNIWRKKFYPYYKLNRKESREASPYDWNFIHSVFNKVRDELKEFFPYKVIEVDTAEADDVIAVLVKNYAQYESVVIVSADKDFIQLHKYGAKQYDPVRERWIEGDSETYLYEHIMRGDMGDYVPNVMSPDDVFIKKERQKAIYQKKLDAWRHQPIENYLTEDQQRNYKRNVMMVDLSQIPEDLQTTILRTYRDAECDRKDLTNYFIEHKLSVLYESIGDFT